MPLQAGLQVPWIETCGHNAAVTISLGEFIRKEHNSLPSVKHYQSQVDNNLMRPTSLLSMYIWLLPSFFRRGTSPRPSKCIVSVKSWAVEEVLTTRARLSSADFAPAMRSGRRRFVSTYGPMTFVPNCKSYPSLVSWSIGGAMTPLGGKMSDEMRHRVLTLTRCWKEHEAQSPS